MNALEVLAGLDWWHVAGWTMLHYLWLGLVVGLAAAVLRFALRRAGANVRYAAALFCLVALAVLPVGIGIGVGGRVSGVREMSSERSAGGSAKPQAAGRAVLEGMGTEIAATDEIPMDRGRLARSENPLETELAIEPGAIESPDAGANPRQSRGLTGGFDWSPLIENAAGWLPWVWIVGAPVTFLLLATGVVGAERLRRESRLVVDGPVAECLERLRVSFSIGRRVAVAVCERVAAPVLVGVVRPMILLPPAALTGWSPEEIEMVLLHELAHVRRWDNLVNLVQRFVEAVLFFQPAVWLVSGWVRREREACCDAVVVGETQRPQAYAELLVALATQLPRSVLFHPTAASAMAAGPLRGRIRRILGMEDDPMLVSGKSLGMVMSGLLLAATLVVLNLPARSEAEQKADLTTEGTERGSVSKGEELTPQAIHAKFVPSDKNALETKHYTVADPLRTRAKLDAISAVLSADTSQPRGEFRGVWSDEGTRFKVVAPRAGQQLVKATIDELNNDKWKAETTNNLKDLMLAVLNYEAANEHLPPRARFDASGKPLLSWRVLVLPYLGEEEAKLYAEFRLNERWDSEHNKQLVARMPDVFRNPRIAQPGMTNYLAVVGEECVFDPSGEPIALRQISDGTANTIAIVEADADRAVEWTRPDDWEFDREHATAGLGKLWPNGWTAVWVDGHIRWVSNEESPDHVGIQFTRAGGETKSLSESAGPRGLVGGEAGIGGATAMPKPVDEFRAKFIPSDTNTYETRVYDITDAPNVKLRLDWIVEMLKRDPSDPKPYFAFNWTNDWTRLEIIAPREGQEFVAPMIKATQLPPKVGEANAAALASTDGPKIVAVPFEVGASKFADGDKITIVEVGGTSNSFKPDNHYWIKGTYTLRSRDRATLSAHVTAQTSANARSSNIASQTTVVERGSGEYRLELPMKINGWPHVSFYPAEGGQSFGGVYFGTGDSVLTKWWGEKELTTENTEGTEENVAASADGVELGKQKAASINNIRKLAIALLVYQDARKSLPARAKFDANGKPLLSWRVLVLPFLDPDYVKLYEEFHLDEPWDSEHNKQLIARMPEVFKHPRIDRPGMTNYLAVVGEECVFDGSPRGIRLPRITDGLSRTIALVEADADRAVEWTKPSEWEFDREHPTAGLGGLWPGGWHAAWVDGHISLVSNEESPDHVGIQFTRAGGETESLEESAGLEAEQKTGLTAEGTEGTEKKAKGKSPTAGLEESLEKKISFCVVLFNAPGRSSNLRELYKKFLDEGRTIYLYGYDVDPESQEGKRYRLTAAPTCIVFRDGKETGRLEGIRSKEQLIEFVEAASPKKELASIKERKQTDDWPAGVVFPSPKEGEISRRVWELLGVKVVPETGMQIGDHPSNSSVKVMGGAPLPPGSKEPVILRALGDQKVSNFDELGEALAALNGKSDPVIIDCEIATDRGAGTMQFAVGPVSRAPGSPAPEQNVRKFPTLEEQRLADVIWRRMGGLELEPLNAESLKKVKALGYEGGLRNTNPNASSLQKGDILVGLHVWPTTSLQDVVNVLDRDDIAELNPLKYYIVRLSDQYVGGGTVVTGRIEVSLDRQQSSPSAADRYSAAAPTDLFGPGEPVLTEPSSASMPLTDKDRESLLKGDRIRVELFYAPDSGPCQRALELIPEYERAFPGLLEITPIDVVKNPKAAGRAGIGGVLPAYKLYRGNLGIQTTLGVMRIEQLELALAGLARRGIPHGPAATPATPRGNETIASTKAAIPEDVLKMLRERGPVTLLFFYAKDSQPCQRMSATFDAIVRAHPNLPLDIEGRDIQVHRSTSVRYDIERVPALVFLKNEEVIRKNYGSVSTDEFAKLVTDVAESLPAVGSAAKPRTTEAMDRRVEAKFADDPNLQMLQQELMAIEYQLSSQATNTKSDDTRESKRLRALIAAKRAKVDTYRKQIREQLANANQQKAALRYDGKTFDQWRTEWQTELSTEKRIEAVKALAAFGRAGYGKEAAAVILDVAGEYDFTFLQNDNDADGKLKQAVIEVLSPESGRPSLAEFWLPDLVGRMKDDPGKWRPILAYAVGQLRTDDPEVIGLLRTLAVEGPAEVRGSALGAMVRSERISDRTGTLSQETRKLLAAALASDDLDQRRSALWLLVYDPNNPWALGWNQMTDPRLLYLPEIVGPLLGADEDLRQQARLRLQHIQTKDAPALLEQLLKVLKDESRAAEHVEAIRAIAAMGPAGVAATEELKKIVLEGKDEDEIVAAMFASKAINNKNLATNLAQGSFNATTLADEIQNSRVRTLNLDEEQADKLTKKLSGIDRLSPRLEEEAEVLFPESRPRQGGGMF